jgi:hypothetical protein
MSLLQFFRRRAAEIKNRFVQPQTPHNSKTEEGTSVLIDTANLKHQ